MDEAAYKLAKEAFVTGHTGSTFAEVLLNLAFVPASVLFYHTCIFPWASKIQNVPIRIFVDWLAFVFPVLLSSLGESDFFRHMLLCALVAMSLLSVVSKRVDIRVDQKSDDRLLKSLNTERCKRVLIWYRSGMMIGTAIAILAVDFPLFPRKHAKVETWGVSLMDVGVGCFIVSSALVSKRVRDSIGGKPSGSWVSGVFDALKGTGVATALGLIRFALVKSFDYQEHVTEYGKHWNFFMTLAAVVLLDAVLPIPLQVAHAVGAILICVYEFALRAEGLQEWIISAPRGNGFLSDNREGILSLFGYFGLYLIAQGLGAKLLAHRTQKADKSWGPTSRAQWWRRMWVLLFGALSLWIVQDTVFHSIWGMEPSRRLCNMGFVFLVLSCNFALLAQLLMLDLVLPVPSTIQAGNSILQAISTQRNSQLIVFVVANLLTGVVNISVRTLYASPTSTVAVLCVYTLAVSASSLFANKISAFLFDRRGRAISREVPR